MTLETINSRQLEYFRRRLLAWRDELTTESGETAYLPDQEASVDFKGHAANANNHTSAQSSQEREQTLIHKIDETLRRIKEGTYGMQTAF
jgi:DnaK suppressor protein